MSSSSSLLAQLPAIRDAALAQVTARNALLLLGLWVGYQVLKAAWNVSSFHPLSHIPGPKLAAATYLPEMWYDVVQFGRYTRQIQKWHEAYGPIIRINPHEVHCADPGFTDEIYPVGARKRDKPLHQVSGSSQLGSGFATAGHDLHRLRRLPLAKFFARGQIAKLEPEVRALVGALCDKLLARRGDGRPINVTMAYSCFTSDAIFAFSFGADTGFLRQDGWEPNFSGPLHALLQPAFVFRFLPWLKHSTLAATWLVDYLPADLALLIRTLMFDIPQQVRQTQADLDAGVTMKRETVFGSLLANPDLPPEEKSVRRMADEAAAVVGAGTETTAFTLSVITYHLLSNPPLLARLTDEVRGAVPDPHDLPSWTALEKLPLLDAVVQEGLRLSYGVSGRTARVPVDEDLVYRGEWRKRPVELVLPRGYAVGMSSAVAHHDEAVYPDSHAFRPDRWLVPAEERRVLERSMLSFSKGGRMCLGRNLAFCEMSLALAALTLRVFPHMRLYETTEADVRYDHDMFIPMVKAGSKGVRVTLV